jgi:hypothetical protein
MRLQTGRAARPVQSGNSAALLLVLAVLLLVLGLLALAGGLCGSWRALSLRERVGWPYSHATELPKGKVATPTPVFVPAGVGVRLEVLAVGAAVPAIEHAGFSLLADFDG